VSRRTLWLGAAFCFVAGDAMAMQSRGVLLSSFEAEFGVSEAMLGLVAPAGTVGFVLTILVVGLLAGRLEARLTLLAGATAVVALLFAMSIAPAYLLFLGLLMVQGAAAGIFRAIDRPLLSHLYTENLGRVFVLYGLAWALGAVTAPALISAVLAVADWRTFYALLGLFFVPVVVAIWRADAPPGWNERVLERGALRELLSRPAMLGTLLAMGLVGGIEGAIFTWLPYYAGTFLDGPIANLTLSAYLLAYVPGRYVCVKLLESTTYLRLMGVAIGLAIPALALTAVVRSGWALLLTVFAAGFVISASFPILSAYGVELAPDFSGPVSSLTTAATYTGIAIVPTLMGFVAEPTSIAVAMWLPVGLAGVLVGVIGWLARLEAVS